MGLELNEFTINLIAFVVKFAIMMLIVLHVAPLMVWFERRAPAMMQRRKGPNRVGIGPFRLFGLFQSLADAIKLIFKEEVVPDGANKFFYHAAPVFALFPALLVATAIPYGPDITIMGYRVPLSITNVDVGFLFIFAVASIAVYGIALAGWACNNKYSLLGSLRASAQMVSYEIPLGMSLIPAVLVYQTLDLNQIVMAQERGLWGVFTMPVSFLIFLICMFAETNRAPFDLAEGESELVAGFHTEYNSFKFSQFFLAEYTSMFTLSCLASTVFFGGWSIPFISNAQIAELLANPFIPGQYIAAAIGFGALLLKAAFFMWLYVWVRWTLPRFRYDQLMSLGWKFMLPIALANVVITAGVLVMMRHQIGS